MPLPDEIDFLAFFECEPRLADPDAPWVYNTATYETARDRYQPGLPDRHRHHFARWPRDRRRARRRLLFPGDQGRGRPRGSDRPQRRTGTRVALAGPEAEPSPRNGELITAAAAAPRP